MERTPSTERVIPIEIIGHVDDAYEDEIDIDNFVENINSKKDTGRPTESSKAKGDTENSSSNRRSLIITHEDGSIEENECTVTCLGISSDLGSNQGLQIEEISQEALKHKLIDEKLKVVIPDMSQVIILEADEVTEASFVSTPEVEGPSQQNQRSIDNDMKMSDMSFEIDSSIPHSTTPAISFSKTQEGHEDTIQHKTDRQLMQQQLVHTVNPLNENSNTEQRELKNIMNLDSTEVQSEMCNGSSITMETLLPEEDTGAGEPKGSAQAIKLECNMTETLGRAETPTEEDGQQHNKNSRELSNEDWQFLESNEMKPIVDIDSESIQVKDIEVLNIKITLNDEGSSEDKNYLSKQNIKENDSFDQTSNFIKPIDTDLNLESKSQQIITDEVKDQDKLQPKKEVIEETVRIIPITLPDGRFVERGVLSDHSVKQMAYNQTQLPEINNEVKDLISRDRHNTTRTITILIESPEMPSTLNQEGEKGAKDENAVGEKEKGPNKISSDKISQHLITKSSQSIEKLSETMTIKQINQKVETTDISNTCSNIMNGNFQKKELHDAPTKITTKLHAEVKQELPSDDKLEISKDGIYNKSIRTNPVNDITVVKELPDASNSMAELEVNIINILTDVSEILDKSKQTEATQQADTCSDVSSMQLAKDVESKSEPNVPILIQTNSQGKSENDITSHQVRNTGKDTNEKYDTQIKNSMSTESFLNQMPKVSFEESQSDNNQIPRRKISGEPSLHNKKQNTSSTEPVKDRGVSKELTDFSFSTVELKSTEGTQIENKSSSKLYRQSSEENIVENKLLQNIPIQIETNIEGENENILVSESKDNNQPKIRNVETEEFDKLAKIEENNHNGEDFSLEAKFERGENPPINIAQAGPTSPVVRTVPIQIIGCSSAEWEHQDMNINVETKSNYSEQLLQNIPIQRVAEDTDRNSAHLNKGRILDDKLIEHSEAPKVESEPEKDSYMNPSRISPTPAVPISKPPPPTVPTSKPPPPAVPTCKPPPPAVPTSKPPSPVPTSKPPAVVRTIPILRQSLSDSGEGMTRQHTSTRQRNKSEQSTRGDILQRVHQELEEARAKLTAQANSLSSGLENIAKPVSSKNDPRSRSVESEERSQGARPKDVKPRNLFKRERTLQDIDKDIETIWKELQELDKPDTDNEMNAQRSSRKSNRAQTPLSEQVLVTPSWRTPTPPPPSQSVRESLSNPNISNGNKKHEQSLPRTSPHTIWDTQNTHGPINEAATSGKLSSSWDSKPPYFQTKPSTHFSFSPKAETKPGAITPSYATQSPKSAKPTVRNIPIKKYEANAPKSEFSLHKENGLQTESIKSVMRDENSKVFKSEDSHKSFLKSEASTFTIQSMKNRSHSPSNVKFSKKPKSAANAQKTSGGSSDPDPPFEWVNFRKVDGEIVKGTILPPLHRENDVIISREVPIINVLLDDAMKEDTNPEEEKNKTPIIKEKETIIQIPSKLDNREQEDNSSSETFNACDAGTQTEKSEKKSGCLIM